MSSAAARTHGKRSSRVPSDDRTDLLWCAVIGCAVLAAFLVGTAFEIASMIGGQWVRMAPGEALPLLVVMFSGSATHMPLNNGVMLPLPNMFLWRALFVTLLMIVLSGAYWWQSRQPVSNRETRESAHWADRHALRPLIAGARTPNRVVIGRLGRDLVAMERRHSILVVGPTQSGKTTSLAIPAILEWDGPVLATSVKTDLLKDTYAWRQRQGEVSIFDPACVSGIPADDWSPLALSTTWQGAKRAASGLCSVARSGAGGMDDSAFWYATAEKLIAPLLFAAANGGSSMLDVVRWVDTEEVDEVANILQEVGNADASQSAFASFQRDPRQRGSVYATAETVLAAFSDRPDGLRTGKSIEPASMVDGTSRTLYLVAPVHEQERLQSAFVALLRSVIEAAHLQSSRSGQSLERPLLIVLDEAANIAPLAGLDAVASVAASHGIQLVTIWQDLAQINARYGARATTVVNNHRAKLICSGISDAATLEQMSALIGDADYQVDSSSVDRTGGRTASRSTAARRLAPVDALRRMAPSEAMLLYAHLPPARLQLRPYFNDAELLTRSHMDRAADHYNQG